MKAATISINANDVVLLGRQDANPFQTSPDSWSAGMFIIKQGMIYGGMSSRSRAIYQVLLGYEYV